MEYVSKMVYANVKISILVKHVIRLNVLIIVIIMGFVKREFVNVIKDLWDKTVQNHAQIIAQIMVYVKMEIAYVSLVLLEKIVHSNKNVKIIVMIEEDV